SAFDALAAVTRVQIARGDMQGALTRVRKVTEADPKNVLALNLLAELLITNKDYDQAITVLTRATTIDTKWWVPFRTLGVARVPEDNLPGAAASYETALKLAPTDAQVTVELADVYEKQGRVDDAIALYDALYKRDSKLAVAANNLAMLLATYKTDRASLDRA